MCSSTSSSSIFVLQHSYTKRMTMWEHSHVVILFFYYNSTQNAKRRRRRTMTHLNVSSSTIVWLQRNCTKRKTM
jgi:hypothetical protein